MKATAKIFIFFLIVGVCMAQNLNDTTSTSKKGTEVIFEKVTWFKNTYWPSLKDTIKNFSLNLTSVVKPVKTMWNYLTGSNKALLKKTEPIEGRAIKVKFAGSYDVIKTEPEDDDVTIAEPIDEVTNIEATTQIPIATEETTTLKQKRKHKGGKKNKHGRKHHRGKKHKKNDE